MSVSVRDFGKVDVCGQMRRSAWATLVRFAGWPLRVYRARQVMLQLAGLSDHELKDIGLTRQDLRDATALPPDADPSLTFRWRAEMRRRP